MSVLARRMRTYSSTQAAVADLRAGKVVAYLTDAATLQYFSQARPGHAASAHSLRLQTPRCHAVHGSASFKTPIRYPSAATCWSRLGMPCPQLLLSSATTTISVFVHCLPHQSWTSVGKSDNRCAQTLPCDVTSSGNPFGPNALSFGLPKNSTLLATLNTALLEVGLLCGWRDEAKESCDLAVAVELMPGITSRAASVSSVSPCLVPHGVALL